jgi:hypothetical protein
MLIRAGTESGSIPITPTGGAVVTVDALALGRAVEVVLTVTAGSASAGENENEPRVTVGTAPTASNELVEIALEVMPIILPDETTRSGAESAAVPLAVETLSFTSAYSFISLRISLLEPIALIACTHAASTTT